jgi:hypothetical protein
MPWIKVDFDKWKDEDEEKEGGDDGLFANLKKKNNKVEFQHSVAWTSPALVCLAGAKVMMTSTWAKTKEVNGNRI